MLKGIITELAKAVDKIIEIKTKTALNPQQIPQPATLPPPFPQTSLLLPHNHIQRIPAKNQPLNPNNKKQNQHLIT